MPKKTIEIPDDHKPDHAGKFHFEFKNQWQKEAWDVIQQNEITFLVGPAGTAKTTISFAFAAKQLLDKRIHNIILSRPNVGVGMPLGHLPGDITLKYAALLGPLEQAKNTVVGPKDKKRIEDSTQILPIFYMRGMNVDNSIMILDECQNLTSEEFKMALSRLKKGKIILCGDPEQIDIKYSGFHFVLKLLQECQGVGIYHFPKEAILRHPVVGRVLDRFDAATKQIRDSI